MTSMIPENPTNTKISMCSIGLKTANNVLPSPQKIVTLGE